ncbi:MAG: peptidylprolyl isomerase [Marinilabiliales bacterium]|nr:MAG: peptidylprolyl isomerase [Marinilabiliales bacterium]
MLINKNTVATLVYSIHINNAEGEVIENSQNEPKDLLFGFDRMISGFESNLIGKESGTEFSFNINAAEAFGEVREEMVVNVPKSAFMVEGKLREDLIFLGNTISMMDNNGRPLKGKVVEINDENVRMDFNHPLAGESLYVYGKILNVRDITPEDLEPKGGCGCGSGGSCGCSSEGQSDSSCGCSTEKETAQASSGGGCGSGSCGC